MTEGPAGSSRRAPAGLTRRTVDVVEAVVNAGGPVGPRGLARSLGLERSSVGRILSQLTDADILERNSGEYVPGPRLFAIARILAALDTFPDTVGPVLRRLVGRFDETCYVCTLHGDVAVFTYEIQSTKPIRFVVELGKPVPLHAGAAGRAILAGLGPDEAAALLGPHPLPALTPHTVQDPSTLVEMARRDRERGFSVSMEERVLGGASVAAPFFDGRGRCQGSVVFTCPLNRLERESISEIGGAVAEAAGILSKRLDRKPPDG